jgi:hypothetical protein
MSRILGCDMNAKIAVGNVEEIPIRLKYSRLLVVSILGFSPKNSPKTAKQRKTTKQKLIRHRYLSCLSSLVKLRGSTKKVDIEQMMIISISNL